MLAKHTVYCDLLGVLDEGAPRRDLDRDGVHPLGGKRVGDAAFQADNRLQKPDKSNDCAN